MRTYTQLTRGQRYQIRALLKAGFSQSKMAFLLRVHRSTISREIRRNKGDRVTAHEKALTRRYAAAKRIKMAPVMMELVEHFICQDFSPEQVSGYLARKHKIISHDGSIDRQRAAILIRGTALPVTGRQLTMSLHGEIQGIISITNRDLRVQNGSIVGDELVLSVVNQ